MPNPFESLVKGIPGLGDLPDELYDPVAKHIPIVRDVLGYGDGEEEKPQVEREPLDLAAAEPVRLTEPLPAGTLLINPETGRAIRTKKAVSVIPGGYMPAKARPEAITEGYKTFADHPDMMQGLLQGRILADILNIPVGHYALSEVDGRPSFGTYARKEGDEEPVWFGSDAQQQQLEAEVSTRFQKLLGRHPDDHERAIILMAAGQAPAASLPLMPVEEMSPLRQAFGQLSDETIASLAHTPRKEDPSRLEFLGKMRHFFPDLDTLGRNLELIVEPHSATDPFKGVLGGAFTTLQPFITFDEAAGRVEMGLGSMALDAIGADSLAAAARSHARTPLEQETMLMGTMGLATTLPMPFIGIPGLIGKLGRGTRRGAAIFSPSLARDIAREQGKFDFPGLSRIFKSSDELLTVTGADGKKIGVRTTIFDKGEAYRLLRGELAGADNITRYFDDLKSRGKLSDETIAARQKYVADLEVVYQTLENLGRPGFKFVGNPEKIIPLLADSLRAVGDETVERLKFLEGIEFLKLQENAAKRAAKRAKFILKGLVGRGEVEETHGLIPTGEPISLFDAMKKTVARVSEARDAIVARRAEIVERTGKLKEGLRPEAEAKGIEAQIKSLESTIAGKTAHLEDVKKAKKGFWPADPEGLGKAARVKDLEKEIRQHRKALGQLKAQATRRRTTAAKQAAASKEITDEIAKLRKELSEIDAVMGEFEEGTIGRRAARLFNEGPNYVHVATDPAGGYRVVGRFKLVDMKLGRTPKGKPTIESVRYTAGDAPLESKDVRSVLIQTADDVIEAAGPGTKFGAASFTELTRIKARLQQQLGAVQGQIRALGHRRPSVAERQAIDKELAVLTATQETRKLSRAEQTRFNRLQIKSDDLKAQAARHDKNVQTFQDKAGRIEGAIEQVDAAIPSKRISSAQAKLDDIRSAKKELQKRLATTEASIKRNTNIADAILNPERAQVSRFGRAVDIVGTTGEKGVGGVFARVWDDMEAGRQYIIETAIGKAKHVQSRRAIEKIFDSATTILMPRHNDVVGFGILAHSAYAKEAFEKSGMLLDAQRALMFLFGKTSTKAITDGEAGFNRNPITRWMNRNIRGTGPFGRSALAVHDGYLGGASFEVTMGVKGVLRGLQQAAESSGVGGRGRNAVGNLLKRAANRQAWDKMIRAETKAGRLPALLDGARMDEIYDAYVTNPLILALDPSLKRYFNVGKSLADSPDGKEIAKLVDSGFDTIREYFKQLDAALSLQGQRTPGNERVFESLLSLPMRNQVAVRAGKVTKTGKVVADETSPLRILFNAANSLDEATGSQRLITGIKTGRRSLAFRDALRGTPLSSVLTNWEDAITGVFMGLHRRIINRRMLTNIYDDVLLKTHNVDLPMSAMFDVRGSRVALTSDGAGALPRKVASEMNYVADAISGTTSTSAPVRFAAGVARSLGQGLLIADASVFGIQIPMFLALNPAKIGDFAYTAFKMMNEEYFNAWVLANMDEVSLYMKKGLRVGTEAFLGGEFGKSWWLEHVPIIGRAATGVAAANDIMFGRWMLYMKTEAIRHHMHIWQMAHHSKDAARFVDTVNPDGIRAIKKLTGGRWSDATRDEVLEAVVKTVNNQLGGLARMQTGTRLWEETVQRILFIVPGFFRARVGLVGQVLEQTARGRPTMEGMAASSILAREFLFSGAVGAMTTHLSGGDFTKINWTDPRRFDWLAAQLPGDDTITTVPVYGTTRSFFNLVGGRGGLDSPKEELNERIQAVSRMMEGRLSPPVSAVYFGLKGEDYLGRKRRGLLDRMVTMISDGLAPIYVQSILEGSGATGLGYAERGDLYKMTAAEAFGRQFVPQRAYEKLDEIVEEVHGPERKWRNLLSPEKDIVRAMYPEEVAALEERADKESAQFLGEREMMENKLFDVLDTRINQIWNDPSEDDFIAGIQTKAEDDLALFHAGDMPGADMRERIQARNQRVAQMAADFQNIREEVLGGKNIDERREEILANAKAGKEDISPFALAILELSLLETPQKTIQVVTASGQVQDITYLDFETRDAQERRILGQYPPNVQAEVEQANRLRKAERPGQLEYEEASEQFDGLQQISRYRDTTPEEATRIDYFRREMNKAVADVRALGVEEVPAATVRLEALKLMSQGGILRTQRDVDLAVMAWEMEGSEVKRLLAKNPIYERYILEHPLMVLWYDYLADDVLPELRRFLPEQVQEHFELQPQTPEPLRGMLQ